MSILTKGEEDNLSFPVYSRDLVSLMDKQYPHRCPHPSTPEREIWMRAGARQLIDQLLIRQKIDEEEPT